MQATYRENTTTDRTCTCLIRFSFSTTRIRIDDDVLTSPHLSYWSHYSHLSYFPVTHQTVSLTYLLTDIVVSHVSPSFCPFLRPSFSTKNFNFFSCFPIFRFFGFILQILLLERLSNIERDTHREIFGRVNFLHHTIVLSVGLCDFVLVALYIYIFVSRLERKNRTYNAFLFFTAQ